MLFSFVYKMHIDEFASCAAAILPCFYTFEEEGGLPRSFRATPHNSACWITGQGVPIR
jgi:hypothetical protein